MPVEQNKSSKGTKKGSKSNRSAGKEVGIKTESDDDNTSSAAANMSKSRVRSRKKSSSSKSNRPKSRPNLVLSKKVSKSLMKANKGQQQSNSPETNAKNSPKKRPKSKSRSGKIGGSGGSSGSGLSCKNTSPKRSPKGASGLSCKSSGPKQFTRGEQLKTETPENAQKISGGGNTIIFLGSPSDPAALQLLQTLVKQINPSGEKVQQPSPATNNSEIVRDQKELEELFDAMFELGNNVKTIHDSYEKIITSLVNLQHRRLKTKKEKGVGTLIPSTKSETNALSSSNNSADEPPSQATIEPGDISRFMDARTRNDAFSELFASVSKLKEEMAPFNGCFNEGGFFNADLYNSADGHRQITSGQRQSWLTQIRALSLTVEKLLAEYNREVLDMFRLVSSNT